METIIKTTYSCRDCGAIYDFDVTDKEKRNRHFPGSSDDATCPVCGGNVAEDILSKSQITVASDEEIAAKDVEEIDDDGNVVMIPSGNTKFELDQETGLVKEVEILEPSIVKQSPEQIEEIKALRDDTLIAHRGK